METIRAHLLISGRVQGVAYRYSARQAAERLELTGWVRNLPDGRVELIAEGAADRVERMIQWCHEGPPGARVGHVNVQRDPAGGEFTSFRITY